MLRILHRAADRAVYEYDADAVDRIPQLLSEPDTLTWIDLFDDGPPENGSLREALLHLLRDVLRYHPLAVEDVLVEASAPRVDDWGEYIYVVLHAVRWDEALQNIDTAELDAFLGKGYLLTYRSERIDAVDRVWRAVLRDDRYSRRGCDYLLYELSDALASDYAPCMDAMEDALDRMEDEIFTRTDRLALSKIFRLKSAVLNLRRVLSPQREVMTRLAREDYAVIDASERVYFRDVYDHLVRLVDINETLRDLAAGALETYLSVTANRTNDVMKTMTIFTMLFSPLAALTGFFGMNFFSDSIVVQSPLAPGALFMLVVTALIVTPLALVLYIRRRGWW